VKRALARIEDGTYGECVRCGEEIARRGSRPVPKPRCASTAPGRRCSAMPSTVIRRFEHSPEAKELTVEFVTGRRYIYSDVPSDEAERLRGAFAKGSYFNRHIRDRYPCRELV
jgi:hypothetical protein